MGTHRLNSRFSTCRVVANLLYVERNIETKKGFPSCSEGTRLFTNLTTISALMGDSMWLAQILWGRSILTVRKD